MLSCVAFQNRGHQLLGLPSVKTLQILCNCFCKSCATVTYLHCYFKPWGRTQGCVYTHTHNCDGKVPATFVLFDLQNAARIFTCQQTLYCPSARTKSSLRGGEREHREQNKNEFCARNLSHANGRTYTAESP